MGTELLNKSLGCVRAYVRLSTSPSERNLLLSLPKALLLLIAMSVMTAGTRHPRNIKR